MNIIEKLKIFLIFLNKSILGFSLCRIYQIIFLNKKKFQGSVIDFGSKNIYDSFFRYLKADKKKFFFSNKKKINRKNYIAYDLDKKNKYKRKFDNIIIFNVFEHLFDIKNGLIEIKKLMHSKSTVYISTPFFYRYHNAPSDYLRYTTSYWNKILKNNNFKISKCFSCGTGPFMVSYAMLFDYFKIFYLIAPLLLILAYLLDKFLSFFQNTNMSNLYPICIIIEAKIK